MLKTIVLMSLLIITSPLTAGHHWESLRIVNSIKNLSDVYQKIKVLDSFIKVTTKLQDDDLKGAISAFGDDKLKSKIELTDSIISELGNDKRTVVDIEIAGFPAALLVSPKLRQEHRHSLLTELSSWEKIQKTYKSRLSNYNEIASSGRRCEKEAAQKYKYIRNLWEIFQESPDSFAEKVIVGFTVATLYHEIPRLLSAEDQWSQIQSNCSSIIEKSKFLSKKFKSSLNNIDVNIETFSDLTSQ